jgi:hypothetical protein
MVMNPKARVLPAHDYSTASFKGKQFDNYTELLFVLMREPVIYA